MIRYWWEGVNGAAWDLIDGPVTLTNDGIEGLLAPSYELRFQENGQQHGSRYTGYRLEARDVLLPVVIHSDGDAAEFRQLYRAWSASFAPDKVGVLRVVIDGEILSVNCRLRSAPRPITVDPTEQSVFAGLWELVAEDPFWYLPTVSRTFESASQIEVNYYGGGPVGEPGAGYPLVRGAGSQAGRLQIENEGDQPAWWTATFSAPSSAFLVSIDGSTVSGAYAIPDGSTLEVNSQEATISLVRAGEREALPWHLFDRVEFAPLPPGETAEVFVRSTGSGVPTFTFWPRRREAL